MKNNFVFTMVSLLFTAEPVHLAMTLSIHFLWMAALHSGKKREVCRRSPDTYLMETCIGTGTAMRM